MQDVDRASVGSDKVSESLQTGDSSAAPFLKWAGGKTQLLRQFEPFFPKKMNRYIEPFLGSAAVFFFIQKRFRPFQMILADNNDELINAYSAVRDDVEKLVAFLKEHRERHCKEYYYEIRAMRPKNLAVTQRAARFIYLNKTCYNGLYRVNSRGEFNVPMGSYKDPKIFDPVNMRLVSRCLQHVQLDCRTFDEFAGFAESGDFFYFDPPYHPLSATSSFTSYTPESFTMEDQQRLSHVYRKLDKKGCLLMLSNSDSEFIRSLYKGFKLETVQARRAINSNGQRRSSISELLVKNY